MANMNEELLVSSWFNVHSSVPSSYVQPPETRPGNLIPASGKTIPVIDLGANDPAALVANIMKASEEFGFFQVINHGVSEELMKEMMKMCKEFHGMAEKDKLEECSRDTSGRCRLYTSNENYKRDAIQFWKDTLILPCPPSGEHAHYWPNKPSNYREVVGKYVQEVRKLEQKMLEMLGEGLGLRAGYLCGELSKNPTLVIHNYPPCPEPSLTLGAAKHRDPTLITILLQQQDVHGLQILKDGEWIQVDPLPNAFVLNIGLLLQMISNGRLVGAEHRVVTNSATARTSVAYFVFPSDESVIEPAQILINGATSTTPKYRSMKFAEFRRGYFNKGPNLEPDLHF